ncbi:MAG: hypothetical protein ACTHKA_22815 [Anaerocolumna jejuensis]
MELLVLCQTHMIRIGEMVEKSEGDTYPLIHELEMYCEQVYSISQILSIPDLCIEEFLKLDSLLKKIMSAIQDIPLKKEAVFFPYNAAMWDSLESIWRAASADKEVETYVIPIPYYEKRNHGEEIEEKYDGGKYPSYVPITDYRSYSLEEHQPDIAYIHNPFDRFNKVTSVHPDYYSNELKKNVTKVVYVPYFLTGGTMYTYHREFPSYYHVDFIVTQNTKMIDSFASTIPRKKFIPWGNPIADRIIQLDKDKPDIPEEWKPMLSNGTDFEGKRTVMYNTSLSMILQEKDNALDKMEMVFKLFREAKDILLIWRPHPLMHATLRTMEGTLYQRYLAIEKSFLEEDIGVLDRTSDVGIAVALSEAYIGEASSVIYMFELIGKPVFLIDPHIENRINAHNGCEVTALGRCTEDNMEYFLADEYAFLCRRDKSTEFIELLDKVPLDTVCSKGVYKDIYKWGDSVYLQPYCGEGLCNYNINKKIFRKFYVKNSVANGFKAMYPVGQYLHLVPDKYPYNVKFDMTREEFIYGALNNCNDSTKSFEVEGTQEKPEKIRYVFPENLICKIRAQELVERTGGLVIYENEDDTLQDFLYLLENDGLFHKVKGSLSRISINATMDGTCGKKIHEFLKSTLH